MWPSRVPGDRSHGIGVDGLWILLVVLAVGAFLSLFFALPVTLRISIAPAPSSRIEIDIVALMLFGLIRVHKRIHDVRATIGSEGPALVARHHTSGLSGDEPTHSADLTMRELYQWFRHLPRWLRLVREVSPILRRLCRRTQVTDLEFRLRYGTREADVTGVLYGIIWSLLGVGLAALGQTFRIQAKPRIRVEPDFNRPSFTAQGRCIMRLRVGYIILAMVGLVRVWRRRRHDGTPDSRAYADGHEQHT
jgi:hypothetical protein